MEGLYDQNKIKKVETDGLLNNSLSIFDLKTIEIVVNKGLKVDSHKIKKYLIDSVPNHLQ